MEDVLNKRRACGCVRRSRLTLRITQIAGPNPSGLHSQDPVLMTGLCTIWLIDRSKDCVTFPASVLSFLYGVGNDIQQLHK